ncbi:MAG: SDR family oxidoreductase [Bacteriovoracaceae bacterium]
MNFESQIVVVTGGTRGIGAGISKAFLEKGATVVATYARNDEAALAFKNNLGTLGEKLDLRKFDVKNEADVKIFFNYVREKYGKLEILINNSGIRKDNLLASMPENDWRDVLETNLFGTFHMTKEAVLLFLENRYGRVVNISSVGGKLGLAGQANYAASKAGQIALSLSLSKEVAKRGITINNVLPGFIETELLADLPEEQKKEYKSQVPMKRFGKVEEVAHAVLFLASKEASYITGASLEISGGL